jgi:hypothetical protein
MAKNNAKKSRRKKTDHPADSPANEPHSVTPSSLTVVAKTSPRRPVRGTGSAAAGQAGALQGLPRDADVDSQSVEELVEEGQSHEADVVSAIENVPEPDRGEVHTHLDDE